MVTLDKRVPERLEEATNNLLHNSTVLKLKEGDAVIKPADEKNRAHWETGIVHQLLPGHHDTTRAVKLRAGKSYLEQAVRHLYPLELHATKKC